MPDTCSATVELADGRVLECALPVDHDGPVHKDENGEAWGDLSLPAPHHTEE